MVVAGGLKESVAGSSSSSACYIYNCLSKNVEEDGAADKNGSHIRPGRLGKEAGGQCSVESYILMAAASMPVLQGTEKVQHSSQEERARRGEETVHH